MVGLEIGLARKLSEEWLGAKCVFTDLDLGGVLGAILTRKSDFGISGITITQDRARRFDFSIPYSEAGAALLLRPRETRLRGPHHLTGTEVGPPIGRPGHDAAHAFERHADAQ